MRKHTVAALLILSLLLAGCAAGGDEADVEAIRAQLDGTAVTCEAEVTAFFEDETETFTLSCAETDEGPIVTVLEPELISGVTARVTAEGELRFDGLVLPLCGQDGVSALSALPALIDHLRGAHLDLAWREGDALAAQLISDDDTALRVWFSPEGVPAAAEMLVRGETAVRCTVTKWNMTEKEETHESHDSNVGGDQSQHPGT